MPEPGRSIVLFEQPIHTRDYALSQEVHIPSGQYGAGKTTLDWVRKAKIGEHSTADQMTIVTKDGQKFLLKRIPDSKWGGKAWLFRNLGKSGNKYIEKVANVDREYLDSLNQVSSDILSRLHASYSVVSDRSDPNYQAAFGAGGYASHFSTRRLANGEYERKYNIYHVQPGLHLRLASPIYGIFQSKRDANLTSALSKAHEAIEIDEMDSHRLPAIEQAYENSDPLPPLTTVIRDEKGRVRGEHANLAVLMRESNLIRNAPKGYLSRIIRHRKKYEDDALFKLTGKHYLDQFTEDDFALARNNKYLQKAADMVSASEVSSDDWKRLKANPELKRKILTEGAYSGPASSFPADQVKNVNSNELLNGSVYETKR
jgi:hypothetical protein